MKTISPLISVVIPFFDSGDYLVETIESVLGQEYQNWELILVDDGSSDESVAIALQYAKRLPNRIKYLTHSGHSNRGVCASRNLGISQARGEYVALLDSDDVWAKEKLRHQVQLAALHPDCAMFCEASIYWYSWSDSNKNDRVIPIGTAADLLYKPPQLAINLYPLTKGAAPCPSGILVKKETLLKIGGFEEEFKGAFGFYEDQAFLFKVYLTEPVFVSSTYYNYYRIRTGSAMEAAKNKAHYRKVRHFFLKWAEAYLKRNNIRNKEIDRLMAAALEPYRKPLVRKFFRVLHSMNLGR